VTALDRTLLNADEVVKHLNRLLRGLGQLFLPGSQLALHVAQSWFIPSAVAPMALREQQGLSDRLAPISRRGLYEHMDCSACRDSRGVFRERPQDVLSETRMREICTAGSPSGM
jgi:hypothetical protein